MHLENFSPFPALSYDILDPAGGESHVVVARGTYAIEPSPTPLRFEGEALTHVAALLVDQDDLVFSDVYYGKINESSVKLESDLAQHKPRCDVIVIGAAHSPSGELVTRVDLGVRVRRLKDLPPMAEAGALLDYRLAVHGARFFERAGSTWTLSDPEPFLTLPIRYEHAFGGELKVYEGEPAADGVPQERRLCDAARQKHPEAPRAPLVHQTALCNPVGIGFLQRWYAEAAEIERWPAPRIESPGAGVTVAVFERMLDMPDDDARAGAAPELAAHGLGVIAKPWQPRLPLAGTFDDRWLNEVWPNMPADFQMAYWNGAHPGMQCEHLFGDEVVELWNLVPPSAPGIKADGAGTTLSFKVPVGALGVQFLPDAGEGAFALAKVDTLIIDLEKMRLSVVWRASLPASPPMASAMLLVLSPAMLDAADRTGGTEDAHRSA